MKRSATAHWVGNLKEGKGTLSTQSRVLDQTSYAFNTRFADGIGTNPEELLGAAHAGCFTMALSGALTQAGHVPGTLETKAVVSFDTTALAITDILLQLKATAIEGLSEEQFRAIAQGAKENCPLSKALEAIKIDLEVTYS
jgi:osmotically inducible protein OsmC